eukprot:scaffold27486_cov31-Tisochrysis_lutea.AAC.4
MLLAPSTALVTAMMPRRHVVAAVGLKLEPGWKRGARLVHDPSSSSAHTITIDFDPTGRITEVGQLIRFLHVSSLPYDG